MPGLKLFTSNRMELLAEKLARITRSPLGSPLAKEVIVVQSLGMARWLSFELATRQGICANCEFPFPNVLVDRVFRQVVPDLPGDSPFDPAVLAWKIMRILPDLLEQTEFRSLRNYLRDDPGNLKRYQLSERIAYLFDQYVVFRPEMILAWDQGKPGGWQASLWRRIAQGNERWHRAALLKTFLERIDHTGLDRSGLPERVAVFGISALPPFHLQVLGALGRQVEINFFLLNPCQEYWADILSGREVRRALEKVPRSDSALDALHLEPGNPLLASLGGLGRDFLSLVWELGYEEQSFFEDPGEDGLLHAVQSDILNFRGERTGAEAKRDLRETDDSIQIHSCHGATREIEVLQDALLAMFEADPGLHPGDILVMAPEIELYAPFIEAVFEIPRDDPRWIPFRIADRTARAEGRLINVFLALLDLEGSRLGAAQVLALLESTPVQRKFSLSPEDLENIRGWVRDTRICWGRDGEHRKDLDLPEFSENSWRAGLDRMLLGYALPTRADRLWSGTLPYDRIEGEEAEGLGRFLTFVEQVFALAQSLSEKRTLSEWADYLRQVLETFFAPGPDESREVDLLHRHLQVLRETAQQSECFDLIGPGVIKTYLKDNLDREGFGLGFLTGQMTFCAMLPMRSIPFKVICLIGLNDGAYPRQNRRLGFDLMMARPRLGDRSRRKDDRYLFLETILSARKKLYLSYTGQDLRDNSLLPPSVVVSELIDYLEQNFRTPTGSVQDRLLVRHRLQAFSSAYFQGEKNLYSYSTENFEAAQAARSRSGTGEKFISQGLSLPGEEEKTVLIEDLVRFFENPVRFLLKRRLRISLDERAATFEENEPFELDLLETYQIEEELVDKILAGEKPEDCLQSFKAAGRLPPGTPGECLYQNLCVEVSAFIDRVRENRNGTPLSPLEVSLSLGGFEIRGRIENVFSNRLCLYRFADLKTKDRLRLWIRHLLINMMKAEGYPQMGVLIGRDIRCEYPPVEKSAEALEDLLQLYWQGLMIPLHFFPQSSWAYVEALDRGKSAEEALEAAQKRWRGDFSLGEGEDPYYRVCFRGTEPLDEAFCSASIRILEPLLRCETKLKG